MPEEVKRRRRRAAPAGGQAGSLPPVDDRLADVDTADAVEVVERFLDSLGKVIHGLTTSRGWEAWAAARCLPARGYPPIPAFLQYRVLGVVPPTAGSPHSCRVLLRLTLVPSGALPARTMDGSLQLVRESRPWAEDGHGAWRVVTTSWQPVSA